MHELSITSEILRIVISHASAQNAIAVRRVLLVVSEISDLHPLWLQRYFSELARGTVAQSALIEVESSAPEFTCGDCGSEFALSIRSVEMVRCPRCDSVECTLLTLPDYVVEEIEVECG